MDISKFFTVICAFVLTVCLVLSITTLIVLRNAVEENEAIQCSAYTLIEELDRSIDRLTPSDKEDTEQEAATDAAVSEGYFAGVYQDRLAIYSAQGDLLCCTPIDVSLLPASDRKALQKGIPIEDLRDMLALLQDYYQ